MSAETNIEWCDSTFNPWIGCTKVSLACDDCYAARSTPARALGVAWGLHEERRRTSAANWALPRRWNAQAAEFKAKHGRRQRVFSASLADVFDNEVPVQWRRDLFDLIDATPNLDWLLLTKRIGNVRRLYADAYLDSARPWPANVWLGATVVNQEEADRDIPKLLAVPVARRFLSIEPMLGPINLADMETDNGDAYLDPLTAWSAEEMTELWGEPMPAHPRIDWVICGGESGPKARPMHPDWARSLRDQCCAADVPFLFKQWGEFVPAPIPYAEFIAPAPPHAGECIAAPGGEFVQFPPVDAPSVTVMRRIGKKAAGRLLDGRTHDGFPGGAA